MLIYNISSFVDKTLEMVGFLGGELGSLTEYIYIYIYIYIYKYIYMCMYHKHLQFNKC